jgi:hypothetical protein
LQDRISSSSTTGGLKAAHDRRYGAGNKKNLLAATQQVFFCLVHGVSALWRRNIHLSGLDPSPLVLELRLSAT